jgi:antirestriction protein
LSSEDIVDLISSFEDDYQGKYRSEEDYAYEVVEECYDLPEFAKTYFDYEKFASDLFISDYWYEDGFVFRRS